MTNAGIYTSENDATVLKERQWFPILVADQYKHFVERFDVSLRRPLQRGAIDRETLFRSVQDHISSL
jgi:hypothetical protein